MGFDEDCLGGVAAACATVLDEIGEIQNQIGADAISQGIVKLLSAPTVYAIRASTTVTVNQNNSSIVFFGWAAYRNTLVRTIFTKITEATVDVVAETSDVNVANQIFVKISRALVTGISSGAHTYDLETRVTVTDVSTQLCKAGIVAVVIEI